MISVTNSTWANIKCFQFHFLLQLACQLNLTRLQLQPLVKSISLGLILDLLWGGIGQEKVTDWCVLVFHRSAQKCNFVGNTCVAVSYCCNWVSRYSKLKIPSKYIYFLLDIIFKLLAHLSL